MTDTPTGSPRAGWYSHPSMADTKRYWDGTRWTDHIAPVTPVAPPPRDPSFDLGWSQRQATSEPDHSGLIAAGYVTAILIPVIGFVIGIVLLAKSKTGNGIGVMIVSLVAFMFWLSALTPDPAPTTYYDY